MPRTRKIGGRRRKTLNRRQKAMKGGGKLDRLPVGPDTRNAAGNPIQVIPRSVTAVGGAGAASVTYPLLGTPEAIAAGKAAARKREDFMYVLYDKPNDGVWTHPKYLSHVEGMIPALKRNLQRGYITPKYYETIASKSNKIMSQFRLSLSSLSEEEAKKRYEMPTISSTNEVINELENDFLHNWDFKYICGHGVLAPELPAAVVPPNTYIRFHSPAGCLASISGKDTGMTPIMAFPDVFTKGSKAAFAKELTQSFIFNKGPLESFSSKAERNALIETPYPPEFCENPTDPYTEASACLAPQYQKQTFYMPGEAIPEMTINFKNNPYQTIILGVYDLPMDYHFYTTVQHTAENQARSQTKALAAMSDSELRDALGIQNQLDTVLFKNPSFNFRNKGRILTIPNPNLDRDVIGGKYTLTEMFSRLPPVPDRQVRFLFINSCRGVPRVMNDTGMMANILGAWGAGAAAGGAGAASKRPLNISQRKEIAIHARRLSLGHTKTIEDQRIYEQLVEGRRYLKTHSSSDPEYATKTEYDEKIMKSHPHVWSLAVSAVP